MKYESSSDSRAESSGQLLPYGKNAGRQNFCSGRADRVFLPKNLNHFCTGCCQCIDDERACPFHADKKVIMDAIEAAEVLIFTTPTYCMHTSAPMKSFLDLTFTNWMVHRPKPYMFRKKAVIFSAAAGTGTKSAIKDIKTALSFWGIPEIHTYGAAVQAMGWEQVRDPQKVGMQNNIEKLAKKLMKKGTPVATVKIKTLFWMMRKMQMSGLGSSPAEKEYWERNGWLGKSRPWKQNSIHSKA